MDRRQKLAYLDAYIEATERLLAVKRRIRDQLEAEINRSEARFIDQLVGEAELHDRYTKSSR